MRRKLDMKVSSEKKDTDYGGLIANLKRKVKPSFILTFILPAILIFIGAMILNSSDNIIAGSLFIVAGIVFAAFLVKENLNDTVEFYEYGMIIRGMGLHLTILI